MSKGTKNVSERDPMALAIGKRIAELRSKKGYTQEELAAKVGITPGAIAQYETGRNRPKIERLERLAMELETSTEWLMVGDDVNEQTKAQTHVELAALKALRALPAIQHETALALLQALAGKTSRS